MYTATVWQKLAENTQLRLKIAIALKVSEAAVIRAIQRKSNSLTRHAAVQVIKEELGLTDDQLFEPETSKA